MLQNKSKDAQKTFCNKVRAGLRRTAYVAVTAVLLSGLSLTGTASAETLTLSGGSPGGTWDGLSGVLKGIIEQNVPDTSVSIRPGGGVVNAQLIQSGKSDIGWQLANVSVDAAQGNPPFKEKADQICNIAAFHPTVVNIITVKPEIKTIADIKGKRVGSLKRGSSSEAVAQLILKNAGITRDDLKQFSWGSISDLYNMLKDNQLDVVMHLIGVPSGSVMDLFSARSNAHILPIPDEDFNKLRDANPAWVRYTLQADIYPGQPETEIAGFSTHLGVNCKNMSEEMAYQITKALINNYKDFASVITVIGKLAPKDLARDVGLPMHPGAIRAYKEAGLL